jgi:hypothetical protein
MKSIFSRWENLSENSEQCRFYILNANYIQRFEVIKMKSMSSDYYVNAPEGILFFP